MPAPELTIEQLKEGLKLKKNYDNEAHNDYQSGVFPLWLIDNSDQLLKLAEAALTRKITGGTPYSITASLSEDSKAKSSTLARVARKAT